MDLKALQGIIPSFKWRVQSCSKYNASATCVAYIDARDVQNMLDEVVGAGNWQSIFYDVGGMLFCKIGIKIDGEWIWKSDTGSESNVEKEKGHVSDAFKRSAVAWGIGRFLYDLPITYVKTNEKKTGNNFPYPIDDNGNKIKDLTVYLNGNLKQSTGKTSGNKPKNKPSDQNITLISYGEIVSDKPAEDKTKVTNISTKKKSLNSLPAWLEDKFLSCTDLNCLSEKKESFLTWAKSKVYDFEKDDLDNAFAFHYDRIKGLDEAAVK
jgi:hypothetical protein